MSRIIIHKRKSGKWDYTITGDDVNENILVATVQGFERKKDAENGVWALQKALGNEHFRRFIPLSFTYMTHAQYTEFMRKHRNQLARNRRARGKK